MKPLNTILASLFWDAGNLPFTNEILEYNREKIALREKARGRSIDYETVVGDILAIEEGRLVSK